NERQQMVMKRASVLSPMRAKAGRNWFVSVVRIMHGRGQMFQVPGVLCTRIISDVMLARSHQWRVNEDFRTSPAGNGQGVQGATACESNSFAVGCGGCKMSQ